VMMAVALIVSAAITFALSKPQRATA
jgi:hypothetical protein